jgi:hypothetical protein
MHVFLALAQHEFMCKQWRCSAGLRKLGIQEKCDFENRFIIP